MPAADKLVLAVLPTMAALPVPPADAAGCCRRSLGFVRISRANKLSATRRFGAESRFKYNDSAFAQL